MGDPKKNTAYTVYTALVETAARPAFKANPTLAVGDFKVSIDGGAFANITSLPTVAPAAGRQVKIVLTAAEMNGDCIGIQCVDAAGGEWDEQMIYLYPTVATVDDVSTAVATLSTNLATLTTNVAGITTDVDAVQAATRDVVMRG